MFTNAQYKMTANGNIPMKNDGKDNESKANAADYNKG